MKKILKYVITFLGAATFMAGCESLEDTYSKYSGDGYIIYLAPCYDLEIIPLWESVKLTWTNINDLERDGILVEWSDDSNTYSHILDRDATEFTVTGLERNYTYSFTIRTVGKTDASGARNESLATTVYARPYTLDHEELFIFTRVVIKQFRVGSDNVILFFDQWKETLREFKIGYYKTNESTETLLEWTWDDRVNINELKTWLDPVWYPRGEQFILIQDVDTSKPVTIYRTGIIDSMDDPDFRLEMPAIEVDLDLLLFNADFEETVKAYNGLEALTDAFRTSVEELELDYNLTSLEDILYFPNLKRLYLGRNRYVMPNSYTNSTVEYLDRTMFALEQAYELMGVDIYRWSTHYTNYATRPYIMEMGDPTLPVLDVYPTTDWSIESTPASVNLENLMDDDPATEWRVPVSTLSRLHVINIDMGQVNTIRGFKVVQTQTYDTHYSPSSIRIEVSEDGNQWSVPTIFYEPMLGTGRGEANLLFVNADKTTTCNARWIRFYVNDRVMGTNFCTVMSDFAVFR